jgi:hypothetical protein
MVATVALLPATGAFGAQSEGTGATVMFEGVEIDLADGWGEATACLIWEEIGVSECFRTEAEMDARITELEATVTASEAFGGGMVAASSVCAGYLRLYDGTSYSGAVLYLRDRFQWLNLSNWGFDQRTSSFKVGPCSSYFADWSNGGGDWYPTGDTQAFDQSPSMISGWNNDVSSVYIN